MAAQEQTNLDATAKLFNPTELIRLTSEIREFNHPQLGLIRFGELTIADSELNRQCRTDADKKGMAVYLMLKKAYPEMPIYTPENISGFYSDFSHYLEPCFFSLEPRKTQSLKSLLRQ